ncbi:MAG: hypothetical protein AAGA99_18115 [Actinomycetota bacterium]
MRSELRAEHGDTIEIITVSIETDGADASREFIEAAAPEHPSVLDRHHQLERLFGVVNIPNVIWIDEGGLVVRPAEAGWAGPAEYPEWLASIMEERAKEAEAAGQDPMAALRAGQDRDSYADAIRDWAAKGADSEYALSPDDAVAASQPRGGDQSAAAAHFELGQRLWRDGDRDGAFSHWRETHRLAPDTWTYKRQAWSLVGNEAMGGGDFGRFTQFPLPDQDWPFEGDFNTDTGALAPGEYYPKTL